MKIVDIFAEESPNRLYAFVYKKEGSTQYHLNEYDRLMDLWTDVNYLRQYGKKYKVENVNQFVKNRLQDAENIQDLLEELIHTPEPLEQYFQALYNSETGTKILSLQKGKVSRRDGLRIYAVKIDADCFVITGGAIKMSQLMDDHPDTKEELIKIKKAKDYLKANNVFDSESFYEFLIEIE
ncbi:MAG: hypothetical protein KJ941_03550 [Bacteroidetes bacterium]|nr:hypothetical protein [Bacteroidota bacterium]